MASVSGHLREACAPVAAERQRFARFELIGNLQLKASEEAPVDSVQYVWQRSFFAVLTEVDSAKFVARLIAADDEVFERLFELEGTVGTDKERVALEDTLRSLRLLRNYDYHFRL